MIGQHDSTALKDIIHMIHKELLLVSTILWHMVRSHLKLPTRPNAGLRAGKKEAEAGFRIEWGDKFLLGHLYTCYKILVSKSLLTKNLAIHPCPQLISFTHFHLYGSHPGPYPILHLGAVLSPVCPPAPTEHPVAQSPHRGQRGLKNGK